MQKFAAEILNSFYLVFEDWEMVEVLAFIEFLELDVPWLCLSHVRPDGQVFFIFLCDEIFEFLFHFYLGESLLEAVAFLFDEGG